jgi:MYXO-CTERM domain-containing protein
MCAGGDAGGSKCDLTASRCVGSRPDGGMVGAGGSTAGTGPGGAGGAGAVGVGGVGISGVGGTSRADGGTAPPPPNEDSCDCRVPGSRTTPSGFIAGLLLAAGLLVRRRKW